MRILAALVMVVMVSSCSFDYTQPERYQMEEGQPIKAAPPPVYSVYPGTDGYQFTSPQHMWLRIDVSIKPYPNYEQLNEAARILGYTGQTLSAFTHRETNGNGCTIHVVDPAIEYRPELLGHELAHCIYGNWHIDQDDGSAWN